jgi:hypothetical protein
VSDFRGADAEGEGAEGAMRARMTVAADDGHAGLRGAEFRADDVHDAAPRVAHAEQLDTELGGVLFELAHLLAAASTLIGTLPNTCSLLVGVEWSMVASVRSGRRTGRPERLQYAECLRRCDLVDEMQIDVQNGRRVRRLRHHFVCGPRPCRTTCGRSWLRQALPDSSQGMRARSCAPTFSIGCQDPP